GRRRAPRRGRRDDRSGRLVRARRAAARAGPARGCRARPVAGGVGGHPGAVNRHVDPRPGLLARVGLASARHPVIALIAWALVLGSAIAIAVFGVTGETIFQRFAGGAPTVDGEASRADDLLAGDEDEPERLTLLLYGVDTD